MISGEHVPKLGKIGKKPWPRLHTLPRLRSRGNVMHSNVSEPRIGRQFDRMNRKACTRIKGPTIQCKDMSKSAIHLLGRSQAYKCNVSVTEGQEEPEGGRPASPRPASLARAGVEATQLSPTTREDLKRPGEGGGHVATLLGRPA